jgi:hypothetical protein
VEHTSTERLLDEFAAVHPPARFWARGLGFALGNWTGDLVCLLAVCHAVGASPTLSTLLLAYVAAVTAASAVPLFPAGFGALDAALVFTLHHGGAPTSTATAADLLYRMITPGLVSVAGWILLIHQRRQPARNRRAPGLNPRATTRRQPPAQPQEPWLDETDGQEPGQRISNPPVAPAVRQSPV